MDTSLKLAAVAALTILPFTVGATSAEKSYPEPSTETYSQRELLKNWALCACLAAVTKDAATRADIGATASAYLQFGQQPIEAYHELQKLAKKWAAKEYSGSIPSEFNTMKCIDMYHSRELDKLVTKLEKKR